jgi:hypothetical protein
MRHFLAAIVWLLLLDSMCAAQAGLYSSWPNFPQSNTFFPITVWSQTPNRTVGSGSLYPSIPLAMKGTKMNVLVGIDNGSGFNYPLSCNTDTSNLFADMVAQGIYVMLSVNPLATVSTSGTTATFVGGYPTTSWNSGATVHISGSTYTLSGSGTSSGFSTTTSMGTSGGNVWAELPTNTCGPPATVSSVQRMASGLGDSAYLIGYVMGDEPQGYNGCTGLLPIIPSVMTTFKGYDSTRPFVWNHTDWVFDHGVCSPNTPNINALQATPIGSFDVYPMTSPWNGFSGTKEDSNGVGDYNWIEGWSVAQFRASGYTNQPIWAYVDTGTNELDYSSQNSSSCNTSTNICTTSGQDPHYYRAPAEVVNAEVWNSIINGAMGVEYFCDDTGDVTAYDFCLGDGQNGTEQSIATAIANNLTYVDTTILNFAPQLDSPVVGICTMNTGNSYISYNTSCSNGILTMSSGTSTVPGSAIVKSYDGELYLFANSDRNGSATMTFTLSGYAGSTATVVYDSNAQYDSAHSSMGNTFTLNSSGQFSDTFGANGHNYQPKIYSITTGGPSPPTGLAAVVQ